MQDVLHNNSDVLELGRFQQRCSDHHNQPTSWILSPFHRLCILSHTISELLRLTYENEEGSRDLEHASIG